MTHSGLLAQLLSLLMQQNHKQMSLCFTTSALHSLLWIIWMSSTVKCLTSKASFKSNFVFIVPLERLFSLYWHHLTILCSLTTMNTTDLKFSTWLLLIYDCNLLTSWETDCITRDDMLQNRAKDMNMSLGNQGDVDVDCHCVPCFPPTGVTKS